MRVAAIDIGSNSTRLLVADVARGVEADARSGVPYERGPEPLRVRELFRRSIVTRLGDKVDITGELGDEAQRRVFAVLDGYRDEYTRAGAERIGGVATSAVRDARNGPAFLEEIERRFGITIELIDGDREARLTFAGVCSGDALSGERTVVVDIGGGSTEFIIGRRGRLEFHVSTEIGAVRHSERFLHDDPPTSAQVQALIASVSAEIRSAVPATQLDDVAVGVGVAGTPTVLASVDQELEPFDPWKVHGYAITREACERLLAKLAALPLARRRQVTGLHPDRAPTIVAGAAILLAAMREFNLSAITVSEHDLLYGIALELAAARG